MSMLALATGCVVIFTTACSKRDSDKRGEATPLAAPAPSPAAKVAAPPIAPHPIPRPEHAVAELAVLTRAPRGAIAQMIAPAARGRLLAEKTCGDKEACDAIRAFARDASNLEIRVEKASEWGVPAGEALTYVARGMTAAERDAIPALHWAIVVSAHGTALPNQLPARAAFAITAAIADRLHAVVYDEALRRIETSEAFSAHAITSPLGAPDAFRQDRIVIQLYRQDDGSARLLTLGMRRFGAADVEIEGAFEANGSALAGILGTIAATLAAGAQSGPIRAGTKPESEVGFAASPHHEGDPDNTFLRVIARGGVTAKAYEDLVHATFGDGDETVDDRADEASLAGVAARARIAFPGAVERWERGRAGGAADAGAHTGGVLMVKLPFAIAGNEGGVEGGVEAMWLEASEVKGGAIEGTLANAPVYAIDLHAGAHVGGMQADLLDYVLTSPDGTTEGGESIHVLEARAREAH